MMNPGTGFGGPPVHPFSGSGSGTSVMNYDDVLIETITAQDEAEVQGLIRRNLSGYDEAGSVLASTFRRLKSLLAVYQGEGGRYVVLKNVRENGKIIGGAGIGSLHGLSPREGLGEVRDLVLEKEYRGQGLGGRLLKRCVDEAKALGYKRLYLETTPEMEKAQKLFLRFGFRPVTQAQTDLSGGPEKVPCYFILEDLGASPPAAKQR